MDDAPVVTYGFLPGILIGMVLGTLIGGIALIGQGVWESGRWWGEQICEARHG